MTANLKPCPNSYNCIRELCADCERTISDFQNHAVEVLASEIAYRDIIIENLRDSQLVDDSGRKIIREQALAEAKQLLGVKYGD